MPAPITSSPLCAWLTYTWTAFDITTQGWTGSSRSETSAWSGWLWIGSRSPAIAATTELWPAAHSATAPAAIRPRDVRTPVTRPPWISIPVTSQPWTRSTPSASAARAYAHATWSYTSEAHTRDAHA